jgi:hypothetical protein
VGEYRTSRQAVAVVALWTDSMPSVPCFEEVWSAASQGDHLQGMIARWSLEMATQRVVQRVVQRVARPERPLVEAALCYKWHYCDMAWSRASEQILGRKNRTVPGVVFELDQLLYLRWLGVAVAKRFDQADWTDVA